MIELHLKQEDTKLVYLAVAYHLGRPGSELDPVTKQLVEHGLAEVARDLQPQLGLATASINLNADQITRLGSGMYGSITELKAYPMLELQADAVGGSDGKARGRRISMTLRLTALSAFVLAALSTAGPASAATFVVRNTNDSGPDSLRALPPARLVNPGENRAAPGKDAETTGVRTDCRSNAECN